MGTAACGSSGEDEPATVAGQENGGTTPDYQYSSVSYNLVLVNEQGEETTTFSETENIIFRLVASYEGSPGMYYYAGSGDLFGIPDDELAQLAQYSHTQFGYFNDNVFSTTAFAVYSEDGRRIGHPMYGLSTEKVQIRSGESVSLECPWMMDDEEDRVFSSLFFKKASSVNNQLAPGRYYVLNTTRDMNRGELHTIEHKVSFTVEPAPWTDYTTEGASRLIGRWKKLNAADDNTYIEFHKDGTVTVETAVGQPDYKREESTYTLRNNWCHNHGELTGYLLTPLLQFDVPEVSQTYPLYCVFSDDAESLYITDTGVTCGGNNFRLRRVE
jgi:hypothetical protein